MLQMAKLFIFSIFGSGDVQPWDSYECESKTVADVESMRRARFTVAGDTTDTDESVDNDSSIDTSDSELLLK